MFTLHGHMLEAALIALAPSINSDNGILRLAPADPVTLLHVADALPAYPTLSDASFHLQRSSECSVDPLPQLMHAACHLPALQSLRAIELTDNGTVALADNLAAAQHLDALPLMAQL